MRLFYSFVLFLISINLWGQEPKNEEIAREKKIKANILEEIASASFRRMVDPKIRFQHSYDACKKELEETKERYKEQALLPDETLETLAAKIEVLEEKKEIYLQIRNERNAYFLAEKSERLEDAKERGLLAKEAYEIGLANTKHYESKPPVYSGVYNALLALDKANNRIDPFNELNVLSEGRIKLSRIRGIGIGKDNKMIYTIDSDGLLMKRRLAIYDNNTGKSEKINRPQIIIEELELRREMDLSPNGSTIASIGDSDSILIHNIKEPKLPIKIATAHKGKRIWDLKYTSNGAGIITVGGDGEGGTSVVLTDFNGNSSTLIKKTPHRGLGIDLSMDDQYIALQGKSSQVTIFSISDQKNAFVLGTPQIEKHATAIAFHPQKELLAIGYRDGIVAIWDLNEIEKDSNYIPIIHRAIHTASISDIDFSKNGELMVVGSWDRTATIWEIEAQGDYKAPYLDVNYLPIQLKNHKDWVTEVAFSQDDLQVIVGRANGSLMLWEVNPASYANRICSMVNKNMDEITWQKHFKTDDPTGNELYINLPNNKRRTPNMDCIVTDRAARKY